MKRYERVAVDFAQALVDGRWDDARTFLIPEMRCSWSAQKLAEQYRSMYEKHSEGPATSVVLGTEFSLEAWPEKQPQDIGFAYVSVEGDGFVEAVAVIVSTSENGPAIREIEWGRP